jgi:hypothetical protein
MSATPRGDLPRNEGYRNFPYGPGRGGGGGVNFHARPSILALRFHAIKTQEDADAATPLFQAIVEAGQFRMAKGVVPGSRDRTLSGKARIRARKAATR